MVDENPMKFFCHHCAREVIPSADFLCPHCNTGFIEEFLPLLSENSQPFNQATHNQVSQYVGYFLLQPPVSSGIQNEDSPTSNFFQNFLRRGLGTNPQPTPAPTGNSRQSAHNPNRINEIQGAFSNAHTSFSPQIVIPPMEYHTQAPFHHVTGLETLLEQIMNWVGNGNAVLQMDPGGLITFMEYHSYDNGPGNSTHQPQPFGLFGNVRDYAWGPGALENIMEQLFNQIEGQGIPPAPRHIIDNLPTEIVQSTDIDQELQCSICMEYFKIKEKVKALPCEHWFHKECIIPWLELHGTCPICRKSLSDPHGPQALSPSYRQAPQIDLPSPRIPLSPPSSNSVPPPPYRPQHSHPVPPAPSHPHSSPPATSSHIRRPIPRTFSNRNQPPSDSHSTTHSFKTSEANTTLTSSESLGNLNDLGTTNLTNPSNLTSHEQEHSKSTPVINHPDHVSNTLNLSNEKGAAIDTDLILQNKAGISQTPRYSDSPSQNQSKRPKPGTSSKMMDLDFD